MNTNPGEESLDSLIFSENKVFIPITRSIDGVQTKQLLYILKDESSTSVNRRAVLFFISQDKLNNMLAVSDTLVSLYDDRFIPIASYGAGILKSFDDIQNLFQFGECENGIATDILNDSEFASAYVLNSYNTTLVMSKSWKATMGDVLSLKYQSTIIILLLFTAGILLIAFSMKILYLPIYRLKKFAETTMNFGGKCSDEYKLLDQALTYFFKENRNMSRKLEDSRDVIRSSYILSLLHGNAYRQGQLEQVERENGISLPYDRFCVVLMLPSSPVDELHGKLILQDMENKHQKGSSIIGTSINHNEYFGFIINFNLDDEPNLAHTIDNLKTGLTSSLCCSLTVGVGCICEKRTEIGRSYIEARTTLDHRLIYGAGRTIYWEDINPEMGSKFQYPHDLMRKLEICLLDGNMKEVSCTVDQLLICVKKDNVSLYSAKSLAYDMVNTIRKVINISGTTAQHMTETNIIQHGTVLADFETIDDLAASIKKIADRFCSIILTNKAKYNNGLLRNIRRYIEDNYLDYSFTVKRLACEFDMSESNLSHYYKNATGHNISDFINELRITKAKSLLVETGMPVRDIVECIGYSDASSFTRKFRIEVGISPGKFRETFRK